MKIILESVLSEIKNNFLSPKKPIINVLYIWQLKRQKNTQSILSTCYTSIKSKLVKIRKTIEKINVVSEIKEMYIF